MTRMVLTFADETGENDKTDPAPTAPSSPLWQLHPLPATFPLQTSSHLFIWIIFMISWNIHDHDICVHVYVK